METQERIRILELAWEIALPKKPVTGSMNEGAIKEWQKILDLAYTAIMETALGK